jgi:hypothetical protein
VNQAEKPPLFFHLGIERTGTTYLQDLVFPHFKGITYFYRTTYETLDKHIDQASAESQFLSFEYNLNQQFLGEVPRFASQFPHTRPIVVFRRQHSWLSSQFKRFVKNGNPITFGKFFDLEKNESLYKREDLVFMDRIKFLEQHFKFKPLVLFYDDFVKDKEGFLKTICDYIGATFNPSDVQRKTKHTSYNTKQLKAINTVAKFVNIRRKKPFNNVVGNLTARYLKDAVRYPVLFVANYLPESFFSKDPLIDKDYLEKIKAYYQQDWESCREYALKNNAELLTKA